MSNPDAIYIWIPGGAQPAAVGKALAERGIDPSKVKVLGQDALAFESALKSMGEVALGIITVSDYDYNHNSPLNHEFVKAYNDEFHRNPDIYSIGGYDGMHLIYQALKKTGGKADGDALIEAAKGMSWESPRGPIRIDPETRDIIQTVYIRRVEKVGDAARQCRVRQSRERQRSGEGAHEEVMRQGCTNAAIPAVQAKNIKQVGRKAPRTSNSRRFSLRAGWEQH